MNNFLWFSRWFLHLFCQENKVICIAYLFLIFCELETSISSLLSIMASFQILFSFASWKIMFQKFVCRLFLALRLELVLYLLREMSLFQKGEHYNILLNIYWPAWEVNSSHYLILKHTKEDSNNFHWEKHQFDDKP